MKTKLLTICFLLFGVLGMNEVNAQIILPAASPAGSVYSKVGLTDVTIEYSRPGVKGREIFGEGADFLQPYGVLWRSGANTGSVLTLSSDVKIGGKDVKAGKYLIFTVPGATNWEFMLYSDLALGGNTGGYDKSKEVLKLSVAAEKLSAPVETLTYAITDIKPDNTGANISLSWSDVAVKVPMSVDFNKMVMANIEEVTSGNDAKPEDYLAAASYYFENDKDLDKALDWVNKGLASNPDQFWNIYIKAGILAKMGKKKEAIAAAEESIAKAKASGNDFGFIKRNEDLIASLK